MNTWVLDLFWIPPVTIGVLVFWIGAATITRPTRCDSLASRDPVKAQLVELRFFAGLTGDQAADVLNISASTADRNWVYARSWLQAEIRGE